eukprot:gene7673-8508_t
MAKEITRSVEINVDELTQAPTTLYQKLSVRGDWKTSFKILPPMKWDKPKPQNHIRFVCISDTHNRTDMLELPDGDVLLHAGDFSQTGLPKEIKHFELFIEEVRNKFKNIVVIAGNHDLTFDLEHYGKKLSKMFHRDKIIDNEALKKSLKMKCTYLEDECVEIEGIKIYGSPWQPEFCGWAFNLRRGEQCLEKWNMIPKDIDILMTHGPPLGHGDLCMNGARAGCAELLSTIQQRIKPKYHIFGHIHEAYGMTTDGITTFINASSVNINYQQVHKPILFDFPIPT